MVDKETIRQFYKRLNHTPYGLTEVVAIDKGIVATGFFDNEDDFVSACVAFNGSDNVYTGRNPRPFSITDVRNRMNTKKKRAKDSEIEYLTAISLDIDPVRGKGLAATLEQREAAVSFALDLQGNLGGYVDDSGNGAYLWISFEKPIRVASFDVLKRKFEVWQDMLKEQHKPEKYGLRIDGCYDFSRIKRIIGTFNHKAGRFSKVVRVGKGSDKVRDEILSVEGGKINEVKQVLPDRVQAEELPASFKCLLRLDKEIRWLWEHPDPAGDTSRHDWKLGVKCVEGGIRDPKELGAILMRNRFGKFRKNQRVDYLKATVRNLVNKSIP